MWGAGLMFCCVGYFEFGCQKTLSFIMHSWVHQIHLLYCPRLKMPCWLLGFWLTSLVQKKLSDNSRYTVNWLFARGRNEFKVLQDEPVTRLGIAIITTHTVGYSAIPCCELLSWVWKPDWLPGYFCCISFHLIGISLQICELPRWALGCLQCPLLDYSRTNGLFLAWQHLEG